MDARPAVRRLGGIASRKQLFASGLSGGDLTTAVRLGELWRVRRGYYADAGANPDGIAAVRVGGRLAGVSAAKSYGLWSGFDRRVHVRLPANASRLRTQLPPSASDFVTPDSSRREAVLHWIDGPSESAECWRVAPLETLVEVASWADTETAVACIDTARTVFGLDDAIIAHTFREASATARARAMASHPGSDSGLESVVRQRLLRLGIRIEQQAVIPGVGRVDMLVPDARLVIELDGEQFHSTPDQRDNDRRRGAALAAIQHREIRFGFTRVFRDWAWCESIVRRALLS